MIVIDPRRTPTAAAADIHLPVRPGSDLPLLSAMLGVLPTRAWSTGCSSSGTPRGSTRRSPRRASGRVARAARPAASMPSYRAGGAAFGRAPRGDGAVVDGDQPIEGRDAEEPGADQPVPGDGQPRAAGQRAAVADGPAERDGRARDPAGCRRFCPVTARSAIPSIAPQMRRLWEIPADAPGISPAPGLAATELVEALEDGSVKLVCGSPAPIRSSPSPMRAGSRPRCGGRSCSSARTPTTRPRPRRSRSRAAGRAVAREGRDDDEFRAARRAPAPGARSAGRGAA